MLQISRQALQTIMAMADATDIPTSNPFKMLNARLSET